MDVAILNRTVVALVMATACALAVGCARWSSPTAEKLDLALPRPQLAPDSVVFEITFVRIPEDQTDFAARFWPEVDEVALPTKLRRHLATNGFRCGLVGSPLPGALQEVLDQQPLPAVEGEAKTVDPGREVTAHTNRLRSRSGLTGKIIVRNNPVEKLATLSFHEDGRVSGESLSKAQFLFSITSFPTGDGQVRVELVPTIEHGQAKSRFRGENGAWMVDNTSREIRAFNDMKVEATLSPGEAVALTCTGAQRGLGAQFFGADPEEKSPRLLLMVRLQQTQMDNRFASEAAVEPVASVLH